MSNTDTNKDANLGGQSRRPKHQKAKLAPADSDESIPRDWVSELSPILQSLDYSQADIRQLVENNKNDAALIEQAVGRILESSGNAPEWVEVQRAAKSLPKLPLIIPSTSASPNPRGLERKSSSDAAPIPTPPAETFDEPIGGMEGRESSSTGQETLTSKAMDSGRRFRRGGRNRNRGGNLGSPTNAQATRQGNFNRGGFGQVGSRRGTSGWEAARRRSSQSSGPLGSILTQNSQKPPSLDGRRPPAPRGSAMPPPAPHPTRDVSQPKTSWAQIVSRNLEPSVTQNPPSETKSIDLPISSSTARHQIPTTLSETSHSRPPPPPAPQEVAEPHPPPPPQLDPAADEDQSEDSVTPSAPLPRPPVAEPTAPPPPPEAEELLVEDCARGESSRSSVPPDTFSHARSNATRPMERKKKPVDSGPSRTVVMPRHNCVAAAEVASRQPLAFGFLGCDTGAIPHPPPLRLSSPPAFVKPPRGVASTQTTAPAAQHTPIHSRCAASYSIAETQTSPIAASDTEAGACTSTGAWEDETSPQVSKTSPPQQQEVPHPHPQSAAAQASGFLTHPYEQSIAPPGLGHRQYYLSTAFGHQHAHPTHPAYHQISYSYAQPGPPGILPYGLHQQYAAGKSGEYPYPYDTSRDLPQAAAGRSGGQYYPHGSQSQGGESSPPSAAEMQSGELREELHQQTHEGQSHATAHPHHQHHPHLSFEQHQHSHGGTAFSQGGGRLHQYHPSQLRHGMQQIHPSLAFYDQPRYYTSAPHPTQMRSSHTTVRPEPTDAA